MTDAPIDYEALAAKRRKRNRIILPIVVLGFIGYGASVALEKDDTASGESEPACRNVTYLVTLSTAGDNDLDITYENGTGNAEQVSGVRAPWSKEIGCLTVDDFTYVSVQKSAGNGTVECKIMRGPRMAAQAASSGPYVIASCSD